MATQEMIFYHNTVHWIKGELLEAGLIIIFGLTSLILAFVCWRFGTTPNAKALFFPILVSGLIYTAIGMRLSNPKRLTEYREQYRKDKHAFIVSEKKRVEDFQIGYKISKIVASVFFPVTLLIFWSTKNPTWQGIAIGLTYFAMAGLTVDYFSQERADTYYSYIITALD